MDFGAESPNHSLDDAAATLLGKSEKSTVELLAQGPFNKVFKVETEPELELKSQFEFSKQVLASDFVVYKVKNLLKKNF